MPKSTLYIKNKRKVSVEVKMLRPSTYLTNKEKSRLVGWTFFFLAERFPIIKTQLLDSVQQLVIKLEKKHLLLMIDPGRHWRRISSLPFSTSNKSCSKNLTHTCSSITEKEIRN